MPDKVQFIEIVEDEDLQGKEAEATAAFRRFFPQAPALKLYRTRDNRIGFQAQLAVTVGDQRRLQQAYSAVMKVLGQKRGRPAQEHKVQMKVRIREPVYAALKAAAERSQMTLSSLVEDLARKANLL